MLDKIILGFLTKRNLTTYDIKKAMEQTISHFYSNSFGSINPTIKKLEKEGCLTCQESVMKGRLKKTYEVTEKGKKEYSDWLQEPIKQGRFKDEVLIRIFFLGDANEEEQQRLLAQYLEELNASKQELLSLKLEMENKSFTEEQLKHVKYQMATLQFGIDYIQFKEQWFQKLKSA